MMKIAAIQSGPNPHPLQIRTARQGAKSDAEAPRPGAQRSGKIRHVLHGWRILLAPVVAQVLERYGAAPARVPVSQALDAYRRWQDAPVPARLLRDI